MQGNLYLLDCSEEHTRNRMPSGALCGRGEFTLSDDSDDSDDNNDSDESADAFLREIARIDDVPLPPRIEERGGKSIADRYLLRTPIGVGGQGEV